MRPLFRGTSYSALLLLWWSIQGFASTAATTAPTTVPLNLAASVDERSGGAAIPECAESNANVFWPVFLTLVVVLAAGLIGYCFWKYYWRIRHGKHLVLVTDIEKADPAFAFDNPGFREGTPVVRTKKQPTETKEHSSRDDPNVLPKTNDERRAQTSDNSHISNMTSSTVIPLKGRDFVGLGFGICGSKRDGIFVRDLHHNGPASESGRIKPGDRITAVRINFGDIEFKDAEDILRSASPYEIEIEIEDIRSGDKRSFFRDQSFLASRPQGAHIAYANGTATKNDVTSAKPAVLEVLSEVSDKMSKYGVKVLPDIGRKINTPNAITVNQPVTSNETQKAAAVATKPISTVSSTVVVVDQASFDEVDLPVPRSSSPAAEVQAPRPAPDKANLVSSLKDANVKKALVQGYQNLKEKITQRVHKSNSSAFPKEGSNLPLSAGGNIIMSSSSSSDDDDHDHDHDSSKIEYIDLRLRSGSVSSAEGGDPLAPVPSKRKAPRPPKVSPDTSSNSDERSANSSGVGVVGGGDFNLLSEIDNEVKKHSVEGDSDSEAEGSDRHLNTTIELNASHITIHHGADDTNRKAASLGDLSKIEADAPRASPLERAVSLELTEHTPRASKKRKAPRPPEECAANGAVGAAEDTIDGVELAGIGVCKLKKSSLFGTLEPPFFTPKVDTSIAPPIAPKLKKSSLFGTMEEALNPTDSTFEGGDEHGGGSHYSMVVSTPLKATRAHMDGWHLVKQNGDHVDVDDDDDNDNDVIPALPTSPIPTLPAGTPSFVTEIDVQVAPTTASTSDAVTKGFVSTPAFSASDVEDVRDNTLFTTAAELNFSRVSDNDRSAGGNVSGVSISSSGGIGGGGAVDDVYDSRDECSSMDTVKEMSRGDTIVSSSRPAAALPVVDKTDVDVDVAVAEVVKVDAIAAAVAKFDDVSPTITTKFEAPTSAPVSKVDASSTIGTEFDEPVSATLSKMDATPSIITKFEAPISDTVSKFDSTPSVTTKFEAPTSATISKFDVTPTTTTTAVPIPKFDVFTTTTTTPTTPTGEEQRPESKVNNSRSNSSSSSISSASSTTSTRSMNSGSSVNGSTRASPRRFSSGAVSGGSFVVDAKIKSPNTSAKSPKLAQSVSPVRAVGSRIPVRANTEPSLKVSLINKEESPTKIKKYDGASIENGKINFVLSSHTVNAPHKTTVLSDVRHNGPNR